MTCPVILIEKLWVQSKLKQMHHNSCHALFISVSMLPDPKNAIVDTIVDLTDILMSSHLF